MGEMAHYTPGRASAGGDGRRVVRHRRLARVLSAGRAVRGADRGVRVPDRAAARLVAAVRARPPWCCCCCRRNISSAPSRTIRFSRKRCRRFSPSRCGGRSSTGTISRRSLNAAIVAVFLAAVFLSWPIWLGPPLLVFLALLLRADLPARDRRVHLAIVLRAVARDRA